MVSNTFKAPHINDFFMYEWYGVQLNWDDFILYKDMGIVSVGNRTHWLYQVVDEKKWVLARLKYGI